MKDNNHNLRLEIVKNVKQDIWLITETHLGDESTVSINEYKWQNRNGIKKLSGGIGFLLLHNIYNLYVVNITDITYPGVLAISLTYKLSGFCVIIIGTYLSPKIECLCFAESVFNHIACLLSRFNNNNKFV